MTTPSETRQIVRSYNDSWARGDVAGCAKYLSRDKFLWDTGFRRLANVDEYIGAFQKFAKLITGQRMISELYGDGEAMLLYDADSTIAGPIRSVEHFRVSNGKITSIILVWDPTALREAQAKLRLSEQEKQL